MQLSNYPRLLVVFILCHSLVAQAQKLDKPLDVIVQTAAAEELQDNIEALGNLHANQSIILTAKSTKTVSHIHFVDGQRVNKGAALIEMTNAEESALMEEAGYNAAEAKKQFDRLQSLAKSGAVSSALLDQSQREYDAARAHLTALQARLQDLRITAPFNGVVGIRDISVGSLIAQGQEIATLNDDSKMKLDFTVPASYLQSLRVGLAIEATTRDLGGRIFKGTILSIDNQLDEATRSIKARALLENSQRELKQGMLMNLVIHANSHKALTINEAALVPMGSNNFVFVLQKNPAEKRQKEKNIEENISEEKNVKWLAEKRQIQIGKRYPGRVEVLSGLLEGEKVVTHGLQKIHDGQAVSILAIQHNDPNKPSESLSDLLKQKKQ